MVITYDQDDLQMLSRDMLGNSICSQEQVDTYILRLKNIAFHIKEKVFSDLPDRAAERFLDHCLVRLTEIGNMTGDLIFPDASSVCTDRLQQEVCSVIEMVSCLSPRAGGRLVVPDRYHDLVLGKVRSGIVKVKVILQSCEHEMQAFLLGYIGKLENTRSTFYALNYFLNFISALQDIDPARDDVSSAIEQKLLELDLNDLSYLYIRQSLIDKKLAGLGPAARLTFIAKEKAKYAVMLGMDADKCFPQFPSLPAMLHGFLGERELALKQNTGMETKCHTRKLPIALPVSQIALLTKLFYSSGVFGDIPLTELFGMVTGAVSSKRQEHISKASFSKEFYSVDQVTAARVLEILQGAVKKIRHDFFPD